MSFARSPFAPAAVAVVGLGGAVARWATQGSGNVWTSLHKTFVLPDPDLGWRMSQQHPIWLGLEIGAVIAAAVIGLALGGWIIRRREARRGARSTILRAAAWFVGGLTLVPAIAAFASGPGPSNGLDAIPITANSPVADGISANVDAPAGAYAIAPNDNNAIVAKISAGHDVFDARFAGELRGEWKGDPANLGGAMAATISVDANSVDTGIAERSKHAREEYLHTDKFPRIELAIDRILGSRTNPDGAVAFRAHATLAFVGRTHAVEVTGTVRKADAAALARLKLTGDVLLVQADLALPIRQTALGDDAGDFDGDNFTIHASLVLRRTGDGT